MPVQVLERPKKSMKTKVAGETAPDGKPQVKAHRFIDMWAVPGLHPTNIDLMQKLRSAEDRQFGANMDTCGAISERDLQTKQWEKTHLIGIRTDVWKPSKKDRRRALKSLKKTRRDQIRRGIKKNSRLNADEKKLLEAKLDKDHTMSLEEGDVDKHRLVLKLFRSTGKNIRWVGSIEEMTSREIHNSLGSKRPLLSFAVNISGYDFVTTIDQHHRTARIPAVFTFGYYDAKRDRMWYVEIKRRWFAFGTDFVIEAQGERIGYIDGRLISLGGDSHVYVYEPTLAADQGFMDLLTLFAASARYHRAIRKHVKRRIKALRERRDCHVIEDEEFSLLRNPRGQIR